jgi:2-iminobutanoate/2-iminopropanoate deaminase
MTDTFRLLRTELAGISAFPTSQGAVFRDLVFTSGHGPLKPGGHEIIEGGFREQVIQTLNNLETVLKEGGSDFSHCVRVLVLLRSYDLFAEFNEIYGGHLSAPYPPRMCFITELVHPDVMVEMHAIGVVADKS